MAKQQNKAAMLTTGKHPSQDFTTLQNFVLLIVCVQGVCAQTHGWLR